jgi:hypothetical protein
VIGFADAAAPGAAKARAERIAAMLAERGVPAELVVPETREAAGPERDSVGFAPLSP